MEVSVFEADITHIDTPVLIVNLFKGVTNPEGATGSVDELLEKSITSLIADKEITGTKGELTLIHTLGKMKAKRILIVGLGEQESFTQNTVRFVIAEACRFLKSKGITRASTILHGSGIGQISPEAAARSITEGSLLGLYTFNKYVH